eukprot:TRINITY_DN1398_c0_g1_i1.p1 TRINITY_DN1398_c0_g1~~TRINITY_DN1398_c0_g1_i1.p1  ORF type:complete len:1654 (-),score=357.29 TRINITY_DN1398_c0_g1_i1:510-5471(-)
MATSKLSEKSAEARESAARNLYSSVQTNVALVTSDLDSTLTLCLKHLDDPVEAVRQIIADTAGLALARALIAKQPKTSKKITFEFCVNLFSQRLTKVIGVPNALAAFLRSYQELVMPLDEQMSWILSQLVAIVRTPKLFQSAEDLCATRLAVEHVIDNGIADIVSEPSLQRLLREATQQLQGLRSDQHKDAQSKEMKQAHLCLLRIITNLLYRLRAVGGDAETSMVLEAGLNSDQLNLRLASSNGLREFSIGSANGGGQDTALGSRCLGALIQADAQLAALVTANAETRQIFVDALHGQACGLAAALGAVPLAPYMLRRQLPADAMNVVKSLIKTEAGDAAVAMLRAEAGWVIIAALARLGEAWITHNLVEIEALFQIELGRKASEGFSRKMPDATYTARRRLAAHNAFLSIVQVAPSALSSEHRKRFAAFMRNTLTIVVATAEVSVVHFRSVVSLLKARMYDTICLLPEMLMSRLPPTVNAAFNDVVDMQAATSTLLPRLLHPDDQILEHMLVPVVHAAVSTMERSDVWMPATSPTDMTEPTASTALVDSAVKMLSVYFLRADEALQQKTSVGFSTLFKERGKRHGVRANIVCCVLEILRLARDWHQTLSLAVCQALTPLCYECFEDDDVSIRRAGAQILGVLCAQCGDAFTATVMKSLVDRLGVTEAEAGQCTIALCFGCIHRYVGGVKSAPLLKQSMDILPALVHSPALQLQQWALHSLALTVEEAGLACSVYVSPLMNLMRTLHGTPTFSSLLSRAALCKLAIALVQILGPELRADTDTVAFCVKMHDALKIAPDAELQLAACKLRQAVALFAPTSFSVATQLALSCEAVSSSFSTLRSAAVAVLRHIVEAHPSVAIGTADATRNLAMMLFAAFDRERSSDVVHALTSLLKRVIDETAVKYPSVWIDLCKQVSNASFASAPANKQEPAAAAEKIQQHGDGDDEFDGPDPFDGDDEEGGGLAAAEDDRAPKGAAQPTLSFTPRSWATRVQAGECMILAVNAVRNDQRHLDLTQARRARPHGDFMVSRLADVVTLAFNIASAELPAAKAAGIRLLTEAILVFGNSADPEDEGHFLLELQIAPIASAIRTAMSGTSPLVVPAACRAASALLTVAPLADESTSKRLIGLLTESLQTFTAGRGEDWFLVITIAKVRAVAVILRHDATAAAGSLEQAALFVKLGSYLIRDFAAIYSFAPVEGDAYTPSFVSAPVRPRVRECISDAFVDVLDATVTLLARQKGVAADEEVRTVLLACTYVIWHADDNERLRNVCFTAVERLTRCDAFASPAVPLDVMTDFFKMLRAFQLTQPAARIVQSFLQHGASRFAGEHGAISPAVEVCCEFICDVLLRYQRGEIATDEESFVMMQTYIESIKWVATNQTSSSLLPFCLNALLCAAQGRDLSRIASSISTVLQQVLLGETEHTLTVRHSLLLSFVETEGYDAVTCAHIGGCLLTGASSALSDKSLAVFEKRLSDTLSADAPLGASQAMISSLLRTYDPTTGTARLTDIAFALPSVAMFLVRNCAQASTDIASVCVKCVDLFTMVWEATDAQFVRVTVLEIFRQLLPGASTDAESATAQLQQAAIQALERFAKHSEFAGITQQLDSSLRARIEGVTKRVSEQQRSQPIAEAARPVQRKAPAIQLNMNFSFGAKK